SQGPDRNQQDRGSQRPWGAERLGHAVRGLHEPIDEAAVLILLARVTAGPAIGSCGVAGCHAASVWTDASRMSGKAPPPVIASGVPIPAARSMKLVSYAERWKVTPPCTVAPYVMQLPKSRSR